MVSANSLNVFFKPLCFLVVLAVGAMVWVETRTGMKAKTNIKEVVYRMANMDNTWSKNMVTSQNCLHIATSADDVFLPGVIGLIKTTYRNSNLESDSPFVRIQFEIFLTPDQSSESIKNLFNIEEARKNSWSYRLHLIEPKDVEEYKNTRFSWQQEGQEKRAVGDADTPHIYVYHLLADRLDDADYVWFIESDVAMQKDIVKFTMNFTRNVQEKLELLNSPTTFLEEYGLPGKTFRENYAIAAFPRNVSTVVLDQKNVLPSVYEKLKKLGYKVHGLPHFNSGILLFNLKLWRVQKLNDEVKRLTKLNNDMGLYNGFGIQPALNLLFGDKNFYHLPPETTQMSLGYAKLDELKKHGVSTIETAYFLHWNGEYKPWLENGMNKQLWALY